MIWDGMSMSGSCLLSIRSVGISRAGTTVIISRLNLCIFLMNTLRSSCCPIHLPPSLSSTSTRTWAPSPRYSPLTPNPRSGSKHWTSFPPSIWPRPARWGSPQAQAKATKTGWPSLQVWPRQWRGKTIWVLLCWWGWWAGKRRIAVCCQWWPPSLKACCIQSGTAWSTLSEIVLLFPRFYC